MITDNLDAMTEEELGAAMNVIWSIIPMLAKYMNPIRAARLVKLVAKESKKSAELASAAQTADKIDKGVEIASDVLAFRRSNREDFEQTLDLLETLTAKYDSDPQVRAQLRKILSKS